jgi:AmmeMemoRadiSam system protein B
MYAIDKLDMSAFEKGCEACGITGVKAMINSAITSGMNTQILDYRTSYDVTKDGNSVVGYMSALIG